MRLMFCPEVKCNGNNGDNEEGSSSSNDHDWKWRREHFILGVAAKDTCVTAMYREAIPKKRKMDENCDDNGGDRCSAKRARKEQQPSVDTTAATTTTTTTTTTTLDPSEPSPSSAPSFKSYAENNNTNVKPSGYTFITPSQSHNICALIQSHATDDDRSETKDNFHNNYMHLYLRIPKYISTMIVPTFSLDYPSVLLPTADADNNNHQVSKKHESKKPPPPPPSWNRQLKQQRLQQQQQQQQQKNTKSIPNSTKDSMPIDTPHGWQKIKPEQYWDAVISLTQPVGTSTSESNTRSPNNNIIPTTSPESVCEGAVGLFDHSMGIACDAKGSSNDGTNAVPMTQSSELASSNNNGKWDATLQRVTSRTNEWSFRVQNYCAKNQELQAQKSSAKFWTPVHLASSQLTLNDLFACPGSRQANQGNNTLKYSHVAIVGWDSIFHSREFRRQGLHSLLATMLSSPSPPQNYLVLSVNDLQSILDIVREGVVSIIGTDLVREWSLCGKALCLDLNFDGGVTAERAIGIIGGMIDMKDETNARDPSPILPGCKCLACRPRLTSSVRNNDCIINNKSSGCSESEKVPSFSRSYIHHLIKANEMLSETLLFVHNLHHVLLLFRELSRAASLDAEYRRDGKGNETQHFEALCSRVEDQLKSSLVM